MLKKLWLLFAQTCAIALAVYFTLDVLRPAWLPHNTQEQHLTGQIDNPTTNGFRYAVNKATPAVVNIYTSKSFVATPSHPFLDDPEIKKFFGDSLNQELRPDRESANTGSGVIVSDDGYILTSHHVVDNSDKIEVSLMDGRQTNATLVGTDPETDLAVIRIDLAKLPSIEFSAPGQPLVGDIVLAIGNPFGVGQTVTMGIVSALGRNKVGINTFENFIQTDAAINPGNSGGALIDLQGRLLGINSAIFSNSGGSLGIGFAIPSETARDVLKQIIDNGSVTRGYIGVEQHDINPELVKAFDLPRKSGVIVAGIVEDSPADKAGLEIGDILIEFEGKTVNNTANVLNWVAKSTPGQKRTLVILRNGKLLDFEVTIGKRPSPQSLFGKD